MPRYSVDSSTGKVTKLRENPRVRWGVPYTQPVGFPRLTHTYWHPTRKAALKYAKAVGVTPEKIVRLVD